MTLTTEERAAIDAFPADRVQHIPEGKSYHEGYVWSQEEQKLVLRNPENGSNWNRYNGKAWRKGLKTGPTGETLNRRQAILEMFLAGAFSDDIQEKFGLSEYTVRNEISELRKTHPDLPKLQSRAGYELEQGVIELKARIVELHAQGMTDREITDTVQRHEKTVQQYRREAGLKPNKRSAA